jgi:hypothetical protein
MGSVPDDLPSFQGRTSLNPTGENMTNHPNNPSPASRSGTQSAKQYVVARQFTDKNGKSWQQGQQYQGPENEAQEQLAQGNIHEQQSPAEPKVPGKS